MKDPNQKTIIAIEVLIIVCVLGPLLFLRHKPPEIIQYPDSRTTAIAYSSLSDSETYRTDYGWGIMTTAHAEWFVPEVSGKLREIEIAAEPGYVGKGIEKTTGNLDLTIAQDENGFPGPILERFSLQANPPGSPPPTLPLKFESVADPTLTAGVKYWLCASNRGPGTWVWRFNDQNMTRLSAREIEPGVWHTAGTGWIGAYRVVVTLAGGTDGMISK